MTCACGHEVTVYKKRDRTLRIKVAGPGDLTGAKIWFSVKADMDDEDADALITKLSDNNGGADDQAKVTVGLVEDTTVGSSTFGMDVGIIEVYIKQADTASLEDGDYLYDCVVENSSGRRVQAVEPSKFTIKRAVSRT